MSHALETVQSIYAAFGRGDIPAILAQLADDVAWESWPDHRGQQAGVPWLQERRGREAVAGFFAVVGQMQFHRFEVQDFLVGQDRVVVLLSIDATMPGGRRGSDEEIHLWTLNPAGQVSGFRHYIDTAKHIELAKPA
jgi:ketosteroid isomerase-like protein